MSPSAVVAATGASVLRHPWRAPLLLALAAGLLYCINLGHLPHPDELYHILAAQGMVVTGEPRIAEGLYTRTWLFTWLVARCFSLFGESLAVGVQGGPDVFAGVSTERIFGGCRDFEAEICEGWAAGPGGGRRRLGPDVGGEQ